MRNFNYFRHRFTPLIWVLLSLVIAISLVGIGFSIYNVSFNVKANDNGRTVFSVIILLVNLLLLLFTLSVMLFSRYTFKNNCLYCYFGLISVKYKISDIVQFTHFRLSNTLVAYFIDQRYTVIIISPENFGELVKKARELKPDIIFEMQNTEN